MTQSLINAIKETLHDPCDFAENASGLRLRGYQRQVAEAIVQSAFAQRGLSFVVLFPRQSGKNELQAQIEAYLLMMYSLTPAEMVKVSPTWKPQSLNAMRRLERVLKRNVLLRQMWKRESGYIYRVGEARIFFFSGAPEANIVGATANVLLEVDEAQDVQINKFDKDIAPMAASTNATRVFWGTAWTSQTLLARELRAARSAQEQDGIQRTFVLDCEQVAAEVPAYGLFVQEQISKLGRTHPMIRTQFFSEEIDGAEGMFPAEHLALMLGGHAPLAAPAPGQLYAFLLDVGGAEPVSIERANVLPVLAKPALRAEATPLPASEEAASKSSLAATSSYSGGRSERDSAPAGLAGRDLYPAGCSRRDATALTIVWVDTSTLGDPLIAAPTYRVVRRVLWVGTGQPELYAQVRSLTETWQPRYLVVDATGIGSGLAAFLERSAPRSTKVIPFVFSTASKSKLGWDFLGIVSTGRWKEPRQDGSPAALSLVVLPPESSAPQSGVAVYAPRDSGVMLSSTAVLTEAFFRQLQACQYQVMPGPARLLRWGVPDGSHDPASGEILHDDLVTSAALAAVLDEQDWPTGGPALLVPGHDPLAELDRGF